MSQRLKMNDRASYYTTHQLGKTRRVTPEGFLLCEGVAIGRTGTQMYGADELPVTANSAGEIRIERDPEHVFRPETIASFEGKPVTINHPEEFVTPENWKRLAVGVIQNVHRGEGIEDDLLQADLLITSADAIAYVNKELPELSSGYDAEYEEIEPGRGRQLNIIGNHVALLKRGRAGPRCAIKDSGDASMSNRNIVERFLTAIKSKDAAAVSAVLEADDSQAAPKTVTTDAAIDLRFTGIETSVAAIAKSVADLATVMTKDARRRSKDADEEEEEETEETADEAELTKPDGPGARPNLGTVLTGDALKQIASRAEILAPGISIPTGDALGGKGVAPQLMAKALETADGTEAGKQCIAPFLMGRELKTLTGDALLGVFNGAATLMGSRNNQTATRSTTATRDFGKSTTAADLNKANQDFWTKRRSA